MSVAGRVQFAAVNAVKAMRRSSEPADWYIALDDRQIDVFKQVYSSLSLSSVSLPPLSRRFLTSVN